MIRLPHGYNGRLVHNQGVPPGDYSEDDPRLFGIADYLVENRFAVRLDEPTPLLPDAPDDQDEQDKNEAEPPRDVITKQFDMRKPTPPRKTEKPTKRK